MGEVHAKYAADLRRRARDLRNELKKRPHLASTLLPVIGEIERKAEQLEGNATRGPVKSKRASSN